MNNKVFGDYGEELATKYLKKIGYKILERNYKNHLGEIDIICKDKDIIVFVEVKTRTSAKFGMPREAIDAHKRAKLKMVATSYLKKNNLPFVCRFDCVEILAEDLTHIKDVIH